MIRRYTNPHLLYFTLDIISLLYTRKLTYSDEVLWPQNLGTVAIANYTFIIDTYHQIHINIYQVMKVRRTYVVRYNALHVSLKPSDVERV